MNHYRDYMDRQQVSPALHDRILALEQTVPAPSKNSARRRWQPALVLAACLCLVLGLGWWRLNGSMGSTGAAGEGALGFTENTSSSFASEGSQAAQAADMAGAADVEEAAPEAAQEQTADTATATQEDAREEALAPPADALLPQWLPEGYVFAQAEVLDESGGYRLIWQDGQGNEITLSYTYTDTMPEYTDWPVYAVEDADWTTVSQGDAVEGVWGFCLYDSNLGCCLEWTTTSGDHQALWETAQSLGN